MSAKLCDAQRLMTEHLQISRVAQAALGRLHARLGNVVGIEANGGGGDGLRLWERYPLFSEETPCSTSAKPTLFRGLLKLLEYQVLVLIPPLRLLGFGGEFRNLQIALVGLCFNHHNPAFSSRYKTFQCFSGSNAVTTRIRLPRRVIVTHIIRPSFVSPR